MKVTAFVVVALLATACGSAAPTEVTSSSRPTAASTTRTTEPPTTSAVPPTTSAVPPTRSPSPNPTLSPSATQSAPASVSPTPSQAPAAALPGVCAEADMLWDSILHQLLLVNCTTYSGGPKQLTVWGWNGSAWHAVTSGSAPARVVGGAALDESRRQLTVYGGYVPDTDPCNTETWQWNGAVWSNLEATPPTACDHMKMIWDPEGGQSLLVGGQDASGVAVEGTWSWDGSTWTALDVQTPPSRAHFGLSYDPPNDRILLFGGLTQSAVLGDLWAWDGGA